MSNFNNLLITTFPNTQYGIIQYGPFEIMININTQMFNMTQILKQDNKDMKHWLENKKSIEMINVIFEAINGISRDEYVGRKSDLLDKIIIEPIDKVITGSNDYRGTYVHQYLVPHILSWCSPEFAIKVSIIVNNYFIKEKDKKIFDLETMIEEVKAQREEAKTHHIEVMKAHEQSMKAHKETKALLVKANDDLDELNTKHDDTANQLIKLTDGITRLNINNLQSNQYSLPPLNEQHREILCIIKLRIVHNETNRKRNVYLVNRCQRRTYLVY